MESASVSTDEIVCFSRIIEDSAVSPKGIVPQPKTD